MTRGGRGGGGGGPAAAAGGRHGRAPHLRPQVHEEHASRYVLGDEVQLGGGVEGALEPEDEGVSRLGVLAQHGELDGDVVHRAVALD